MVALRVININQVCGNFILYCCSVLSSSSCSCLAFNKENEVYPLTCSKREREKRSRVLEKGGVPERAGREKEKRKEEGELKRVGREKKLEDEEKRRKEGELKSEVCCHIGKDEAVKKAVWKE